MDTRIYVITHKQFQMPQLDGYIPLQVGAACNAPLPYLKDNTGENISDRNYSYCELTGVYWIYRNISCDQIGICHYRRFFAPAGENRPFLLEEIQDILTRYDVIIPYTVPYDDSTFCQFKGTHTSNALLVCREVLAALYPDYLVSFDFVMKHILFSGCNMSITSSELFHAYCDWLFPVLFRVEEIIRPAALDGVYKQRVLGFLGERLQQVWLMMQPVRIYEANCYLEK